MRWVAAAGIRLVRAARKHGITKVADTGVVYLCRFAEGEGPVRRFLESYRAHPTGLEHDLHIVLKGFPDRASLESARLLFGSLSVNTIEVCDTGYDIGSYFAAAKAVGNAKLLFLNTFSEILADDWLAHFDRALGLSRVGLVGATGSWQCASSGYEAKFFKALRHMRVLRGPPAHHNLPTSQIPDSAVGEVAHDHIDIHLIFRKLLRACLYPVRLYQFGRYPNPHIRTNAFMVQRALFLSLRETDLKRKIDAYKFESGRHSLTKQIMSRGLRPVVVDRWGRTYEIEEWKSSSTFWVDLQANLLVADNQTTGYMNGSLGRRRTLESYAWENPWFWDMPGPL
jgi:hypothetical protein